MMPQLTMSNRSMSGHTAQARAEIGGVLVSADGRELPLRGTTLRADCGAGVGRVLLEQRFVNPYDEPLRVHYRVPLPPDGVVAGFSFRIDDHEIVGRVEPRDRARAHFEQAIADGHTAALLEQERSSVFTQEVGNIAAGASVHVRLEIDQKLVWIGDGSRSGWEWRFPTVVAPRYLGLAGRVADADCVQVEVADNAVPNEVELSLAIRDDLSAPAVASPSHRLRVKAEGASRRVALADGAASLDRDVVVRWSVAGAEPGLTLEVARPPESHERMTDAFGLLTIVPPASGAQRRSIARDLIVLLDTSGSMHGAPLDQAKRLVSALVDALGEDDRLELIEFSTQARRFTRRPVPGTRRQKAAALAWLRRLEAGGGTEMRTGLLEALAGLRPEAQRQVVLVSDGLIGFEDEIVAAILHRLPSGSRVHTVGVGSAVNRSLTGPAARAGRGLEVIIGIDEDPEPATQRILAHTSSPLVVDVQLEGSALLEQAPMRLPDLFAGAPTLCSLRLRAEGGSLLVRGRTEHGSWTREVHVPATSVGCGSAAIISLFGRECVEDLEMRRAAGEQVSDLERGIEALGVAFQISTRLTSWIAVSEEPIVDPRDPSRTITSPQALPHGMSVAGFGLRAPAHFGGVVTCAAPAGPPPAMPRPAPSMRARAVASRGAPPSPPAPKSMLKKEAAKRDEISTDEAAIESAYPPPRAPHFEPSALADGVGRSLAGRLVLVGARQVVVEARVEDTSLEWRVPIVAVLKRADGTRVEVRIVAERTTRDGEIQPGMLVRIAFEGADLDEGPRPVALVIDGEHEVIEVHIQP